MGNPYLADVQLQDDLGDVSRLPSSRAKFTWQRFTTSLVVYGLKQRAPALLGFRVLEDACP
jgi:hypothetical protein